MLPQKKREGGKGGIDCDMLRIVPRQVYAPNHKEWIRKSSEQAQRTCQFAPNAEKEKRTTMRFASYSCSETSTLGARAEPSRNCASGGKSITTTSGPVSTPSGTVMGLCEGYLQHKEGKKVAEVRRLRLALWKRGV